MAALSTMMDARMTKASRRLPIALMLAVIAMVLAPLSQAGAQGLFTQPKYAAIVVDANSGEVLYDRRADELRHPASISKVMTLYLTFEALATGRLSLGERVTVSPHAYSMAPSKTRLLPGQSLTVDEAIRVTAVHSANDIAVALAERIGGDETHFAELMTLRAQELGMRNTHFANASGLPDPRQISTARDISILSRAVMRDYPQYYAYFGQKSLEFDGQVLTNHNHLLAKMPGVDGIKTGFVNAAGFNLAASAVRDGKRLIAVVLGGPSTAARDENVEELLNAGFSVLDRRSHGLRMTIASIMAEPEDMSGPIERAPIEQGSGDQPNLQVMVQPQIRTLPMMAAAKALQPTLQPSSPILSDALADPCRSVGHRHRRHARAKLCENDLSEIAARAAPKATAREETASVEAKPCTTHARRRHRAACDAEPVQVASVKPARAETAETASRSQDADRGVEGFMIQVGAYKNQGQAKDHLDKVAGDFSRLIGSASPKVEKASGNYRVRFRGLSQQQAKAACHSLAAKGQPCVVMAAS